MLVEQGANMFDYTLNNHFRFGYDEEWFNTPEEHHAEWNCEYGVCQRKPMGFHLECRRAARLISRSTDLMLNLAFSGGVDSEVMVRAFMAEDLPFKISIVQFNNDYNLHDISFAISFCEEHRLDYNIIPLNVDTFWHSTAFLECADEYKCFSPMLCTYFQFFNEMDGLPVIGMGEGCISKYGYLPIDYEPGVSPYSNTPWDMIETEKNLSATRFFIQQDCPGIPAFYRYTPELMYSLFNDPIMHELSKDERHGKLTSSTSKFEIYQRYHPDLRKRPEFSGFEKLVDREVPLRKQLRERLEKYTRMTLVEYNEGLQRLGGAYHKSTIQTSHKTPVHRNQLVKQFGRDLVRS